jgi:hypothetical protein
VVGRPGSRPNSRCLDAPLTREHHVNLIEHVRADSSERVREEKCHEGYYRS